jgi:hypothetical protein
MYRWAASAKRCRQLDDGQLGEGDEALPAHPVGPGSGRQRRDHQRVDLRQRVAEHLPEAAAHDRRAGRRLGPKAGGALGAHDQLTDSPPRTASYMATRRKTGPLRRSNRSCDA